MKTPLSFSIPLLIPSKVLPPPIAIINEGSQQQLVAIIKANELPSMDFL
ncbi:hypothetical protein N8223_02000 [Bacteroidia bacterium]|nr:hypothetical protein [Bacteroidia bacterium]MDC1431004.1 hypothetical protein [Bacteroidia bacterium]